MLVVYIDSTKYSLCRGKSLRDYENLYREALDKNAFKLLVLFAPRIVDQPELIDYLVLYGPDFPIYIDVQRSFSAHLQSSVANHPKIVHNRNMKKGRSDTPLS